jgi:hypothetical protein
MSTLASDAFSGTLSNWINNTGDFAIVSGQARATTDDSLISYDGGVSWPNDQWSNATLNTNVGNAANNGTGTTVRGSASAGTDSAYEAYCSTNGTRYYKAVAGSFTQLGSDDTSVTWSAGNVCYLEIQGTTLLAKRGGSGGTAATSTSGDSTFASGKPGIQFGHGGTTCDIDDWSGGDFASSDVLFAQVLT